MKRIILIIASGILFLVNTPQINAIYEPRSIGMQKIDIPNDKAWFLFVDYGNTNPENLCQTDGTCLRTGLSNFPWGSFGSLAVNYGFNPNYYVNYRIDSDNFFFQPGKKGKPLGIDGFSFYTSNGVDMSPVVSGTITFGPGIASKYITGSTTQQKSENCQYSDGGGQTKTCKGYIVCPRGVRNCQSQFSCSSPLGQVCTPQDTISTWDVPAYSDTGSWWDQWTNAVNQLGTTFKNDDRVHFGVLTYGVDGEGPCTKFDFLCPDTWNNYYNKTTALFHNAWKRADGKMKPLLGQWLIDGDSGALRAAGYDPPLGIRHGAYTEDSPNALGYGAAGYKGIYDVVRRFNNKIPTGIEALTAIGFGLNPVIRNKLGYWYILQQLWMRPTIMDRVEASFPVIAPDVFATKDEAPDYFNMLNNYLRVNAVTTPSVWVAMFDTANLCAIYYPPVSTSISQCNLSSNYDGNCCMNIASNSNVWLYSGKRGDLDFYLKRVEFDGAKTFVVNEYIGSGVIAGFFNTTNPIFSIEIPDSARSHPFSLHSRRTDQETGNFYMLFDIDNDYPWAGRDNAAYEVSIYFLDKGSDPIYFQYKDKLNNSKEKVINKTNSNLWKTETFILNDAYFNDNFDGFSDFRIYNGGLGKDNIYLHMIKIKGLSPKPDISNKIMTKTTCQINPNTYFSTDTPTITVKNTDFNGQVLNQKRIKVELYPNQYHGEKVFYGITNSEGIATITIPLQGLPRGLVDVETSFVGDANYFGSKTTRGLMIGQTGKEKTQISISQFTQKPYGFGEIINLSATLKKLDGTPINGAKLEYKGWGGFSDNCYNVITNSSGIGTCGVKIVNSAIAGVEILTVFFKGDSSYAGSSANIDVSISGLADYPVDLPIADVKKGWNIINLTGFAFPGNCSKGSINTRNMFTGFISSFGIPSSLKYYLWCK